MRVLVVEDDALLGQAIAAGLGNAGFAVDWLRDGVDAAAAMRTTPYAAVVLDLGLPRLDGLEVLAQARRRNDRTPVLVLTARDAVSDRVKGLDAGADDYLVKPFDLDELAARLRALIRRAHGEAAPLLAAGALALDPAARTVTFRGVPVDLSAREFDLLRELMLAAGRVLTRDQLAERLYAWGEDVESNALEVHVHHLRRKLAPDIVRTVRGVGYMLPKAGVP